MSEKSKNKSKNVNSKVDIYLRLMVFPSFEPRERHYHRICLLQVGQRCEVLEELKDWAQSSPAEYKQVVDGLNKIAGNEILPRLKTIKRVGKKREIVQISGGNARFYGFQDSDQSYTFVCVHTFWIGSGNKIKMQNLAIKKAEMLKTRWQNAQPVEGHPDLRRGKG